MELQQPGNNNIDDVIHKALIILVEYDLGEHKGRGRVLDSGGGEGKREEKRERERK